MCSCVGVWCDCVCEEDNLFESFCSYGLWAVIAILQRDSKSLENMNGSVHFSPLDKKLCDKKTGGTSFPSEVVWNDM